MARNLFVSDPLLATVAGGGVQLAAGQPFTLWTDRSGGSQVTDCTAPDAITALPATNGVFNADGNGQPPPFRGPSDVVLVWLDAGAGRYPLFAIDLLFSVLTTGNANAAAVASSAQKATDALAAAQAAQTQAAQAAASAQQAAASASAAAQSGGTGGLSTTALDDYLNGTSTASAAALIQRVIGFRMRATPTDASTAWAARPTGFLVVAAIGPGPGPTDAPPAGCIDVDWTYTS